MELVFIRHGEGEHTLDIPSSLHLEDPALTATGKEQAKLLRNQLPLNNRDIVFISPIRRTLETAYIWSENIDCRKIVSPFVSPRIFPIRSNCNTLPCDKLIDFESILDFYPTFEIDCNAPRNLWAEGINTLPENQFTKLTGEFIVNCKQLQKDKIYIVSHDGTITSYRQMITGQSLTRKDFLNETDWFQITC